MKQHIIGGLLIFFAILFTCEVSLRLLNFSFYPGEYYTFDQAQIYGEIADGVYSFGGYENLFTSFGRSSDERIEPLPFGTKKENEIRIFIFGGSVCNGLAQDLPLMKRKLEKIFPQKKFLIIDYCVGSFSTDRIMHFYHETFRYDPDVILIHAGNNEFLEPVLSKRIHSKILFDINNILIFSSRTYQLQSYIIYKIRIAIIPHLKTIDGLPKYEEIDTQNDPLNYNEILNNYKKNLEEMYQIASLHKTQIIFSTVTHNRRTDDFKKIQTWYDINDLIMKGEIKRAIEIGDKECLLNRSTWHATTETNNIVKKVAQKKNIPLADIDQAVINNYIPHTTGYEYFVDTVHYAYRYDGFYNIHNSSFIADPIEEKYRQQIENKTYEKMNLTYLSEIWINTFIETIVEANLIT